MDKKNDLKDEALELVWNKKEEGSVTIKDILENKDPVISQQVLDEMLREDYLFEVSGEVNLTEKGRARALHLARAHRLAERLFSDVLEISSDESLEANACTFEHILSMEVMEAICTLLGHPKECPHGRPIPQGECCKKAVKTLDRLVLPLSELKAGESGKIAYAAIKNPSRLDQLTNLGVSPGQKVTVQQRVPTFVIKAAQTDIAMDKDVLKDIYVRKVYS